MVYEAGVGSWRGFAVRNRVLWERIIYGDGGKE